jgi:hypothetical protein
MGQQLFEALAVFWEEGDTTTRLERELVARDLHGLGQLRLDASGNGQHLVRVDEAWKHGGELVAAEFRYDRSLAGVAEFATYEIRTAQRADQSRGKGHEREVTDLMSQGIVERFESVDIEIEHRNALAALAGFIEEEFAALGEESLVAEPCQRIDGGA